jgi:arylsulfatase A
MLKTIHCIATLLLTASGLATASERPNIILILMDDMGYNDVGAFTYPAPPNQYPVSGPAPQPGYSDPDIPAPNHAQFFTPNIDSLASGGLIMPQFYANTLCSPSRAALLTGRYSKRVSVNKVFFPSNSDPDRVKGLNTTELTLPEILREHGYATGMIGKWHLGYVPAAHERFQMMPTRHGFMEFFGSPHSNDMASFDLIRGETVVEPHFATATKQAELTWRYTEEALDFIRRRSAEEKPFFLYFAQIMTHIPCWPSDRTFANADGTTWPKFKDSSGVSHYYDIVKEVDHSVGRVLAKLDELNIANNTMVIFTSDNGPWLSLSSPNLTDRSVGSAYPFRNGKFSTWEGGVRVPLLARWPGKIAPGTAINDQVGAITDFLPTLTGLAGATPPAGRTIDGIDLWPVWSGQSAPVSRSFAHFADGGGLDAIVKDTWKLRSGKLYDVRNLNDQETTDHAAAQPAVVADLVAARTAIENSLAAETTPLGLFTSYEVELSANDLVVPTGGTATFSLSLSANPNKTVTVSVSRFSGNTDLSVSGGAGLVFNTSNWAVPQTVTLSAAPGSQPQAEGATFRVTTNDIAHVREVFAFVGEEVVPPVSVSLVWPKVDPAVTAGIGVKLIAEGSAQVGLLSNPPGTTYSWSKVSGPGSVAFTHPAAAETGVSFGADGIHQIRLTADHPDAGGPGNTQFTIDVGATGGGGTGGLKFSPPLVYDASQDLDGDLVWQNLASPGSGDVTFSSGVTPNVLGSATQSETVDFDPAGEFSGQFTGGSYAESPGAGLNGTIALTLANVNVSSFSGNQSVSLSTGGFTTGTAVTVGAHFKMSALGTATGVAGQILRLGLTNGGTDNFASLPFGTIEMTNPAAGTARFVSRESLASDTGSFTLATGQWYYFEATFTRGSGLTVNYDMRIASSSASGVVGTVLDTYTFSSASELAAGTGAMDGPIFGAFKGHQAYSNGASGVMDHLSVSTAPPPSPIDPAPSLAFISSAVDFPGGLTMEGGVATNLDAYSTGNASFEFWFKPDFLPTARREILWETGGDIGVSFILDGSTLRFVVDDGGANAVNGAIASAILVPDPAQDGFIHAVGVIDLTNDEIRLYIDGSLADTRSIPGVADWCGTSGTGFAKIDAAAAGTDGSSQFSNLGGNDQLSPPVQAYAGLMAMARFYNRTLSTPNVAGLHTDPHATETTGNVGPEVSAGATNRSPTPQALFCRAWSLTMVPRSPPYGAKSPVRERRISPMRRCPPPPPPSICPVSITSGSKPTMAG